MWRALRTRYFAFVYFKRRRDATLAWLATQASAHVSFTLLAVPPWGSYSYVIHNGHASLISQSPTEPDVILTTPSSRPHYVHEPLWHSYFHSPFFEVWVHTERAASSLILALSSEEQDSLLASARTLVRASLTSSSATTLNPQDLPHSSQPVGIGITLWHNGTQRGCMLVYQNTLEESLRHATFLAVHDARYATLREDELAETRIEVTLLSTLRIPFCPDDGALHMPYYHLGYHAFSEGALASSFIPAVHNTTPFPTQKDFLHALVHEKARLPQTARATVAVFPTKGIIEGARGQSIALEGPVPVPVPISESDTRAFFSTLSTEGAEWLLHEARTHNLLRTPSLTSSPQTPEDVTRALFSAYALRAYCAHAKDSAGSAQAHATAEHLFTRISQETTTASALAHLYYAHFLIADERMEEAQALTEQYHTLVHTFDPLTLYQYTRLLQKLSLHDPTLPEKLPSLIERCIAEFKRARTRPDAPLAVHAELIAILSFAQHPFLDELCVWYLALQHDDGSFPNTPTDHFSYSRGTGKILEALATTSCTDACMRALAWLSGMQYTENTLYHISHERHSDFLGALRHDMGNRDAWVDAVGHVLLAYVHFTEKHPAP